MNASTRTTMAIRRLYANPRLGIAVLIMLVTGGACARVEPPDRTPSSSTSFHVLKQEISRIRGLVFETDIAFETRSREAYSALLKKNLLAEFGNEEKLSHLSRAYKRIGLLPESTDLTDSLSELQRLRHPAVYDGRGRTVIAPANGHPSRLSFFTGTSEESSPSARQLPLTLGVAQALQEQQFHWQEKLRTAHAEDERLALRAVVLGDAALTALAHVTGESTTQTLTRGIQGIARWATSVDKHEAALPEFVKQKLVFPYLEGSRFVLWAYSAKGWQGVNRIHSDPPRSTAQILHPEKFYAMREEPLRITPWGLAHRMKSASLVDETVGESLVVSLLKPVLGKERAAEAAAGWIGDDLSLYRNGDHFVLGWVTAWRDAQSATEFHRRYRTALERRHRAAFEATSAGADSLIAVEASGRALLLQRKDNFVLLLDELTSPRALEVAEEIWRNLETGTESTPIPYDTARLPRQSPWIKR